MECCVEVRISGKSITTLILCLNQIFHPNFPSLQSDPISEVQITTRTMTSRLEEDWSRRKVDQTWDQSLNF